MHRFTRVVQVSKHDVNETMWDAFMVDTDGDIHIETFGGDDVTLAVTAGEIYPIAVRRIFDTDTTVGEVFGLA